MSQTARREERRVSARTLQRARGSERSATRRGTFRRTELDRRLDAPVVVEVGKEIVLEDGPRLVPTCEGRTWISREKSTTTTSGGRARATHTCDGRFSSRRR